MELVEIKGHIEAVANINHCYELIDKYMGHEFARILQEYHREQVEEMQEKIDSMWTEEQHDASQEELKAALLDAVDGIDEVLTYLDDTQRMNRNKLLKSLRILKENLQKAY